jgi:hypothetical protein
MKMRVDNYSSGTMGDFLHESSFWMPTHGVESAWVGHAPFAFWIVNTLKPRTVVELGVHHGFSYLAFCQAVKYLRLNCVCSGIDTWRGDEHAGFYGTDVFDRLRDTHRPYDHFSRLIRSTFDAAVASFTDGSIDLLHIDGCHHYESVKHDFETWKPKLSNRAIVLIHDTHEPTFGVSKFWNELRKTYPHFQFAHAHGLGVLGFGENLPIKLNQLFMASDSPEISRSIQSAYQQLGQSIIDRQKIDRLEQEIDRLEQELEQEIDRLEQEMERLENVVQSYRSSASWRLTAPLRYLSRFARQAFDINTWRARGDKGPRQYKAPLLVDQSNAGRSL